MTVSPEHMYGMPINPLHAVVFDLDGLMFNTEEIYEQVGAEVLGRRGKPFELELLHQIMGRPGPVALQMMIDWHALDVTVEEFAAESEEVFCALLEGQVALMPGLEELLAALEAKSIPKAIATSSGRRVVEEVLDRFDMQPRFEFVLTSEDITHGKPDPEIYFTASRRLGRSPERVMVLEDSQNGCTAAVAAGTFVVAVPGGHSLSHDFDGVQFVAESLADRRIYEALRLE